MSPEGAGAAARRLLAHAPPARLALVAITVTTTLTPLTDGDLWWHLAAGREMVATRAFLRVDPFTLSAMGRPWPDVHWLFQLGVWGLWQLGGLGAIVIAKVAVVAAGATLLHRASQRDPRAGTLCALLLATGLFVARHLVLVRPVVITLLFLAAFFLVLERAAARRWLFLLPALQVFWVNTQGLFLLGPAVVAAYAMQAALERQPSRRLFLALGLTLLACLATPYGRFGFALPATLLARLRPGGDNVFSSDIAENVPPYALASGAPGAFVPLAVALALTAASFIVAGRKLRPAHALIALGFAALALMANRNVLLFYWMAAPIVALNLATTTTRVPRLAWPIPFVALAALVIVARADETSFAAPAPFRVPAAALDHVVIPNDRPARVFTADHYGGYVSFRLHPHAHPYLDTRLVLHTADEYRDFLGLLDHPARFAEFQRRQRFDYALLPTAFPDRYLGLVQALAAAPDWRLVYTDGSAVLFAATPSSAPATTLAPALDLDAPATTAAVLDQIDRRLPVATARGLAARRHLARLLLVTGHGARALDALATLPANDADALALRARVHLVDGDVAPAEAAAQALLALRPEAPAALDLLASAALARGDQPAAIGFLRRSLAADPFGAEARALLARFEAQQRRARRLEAAKP